MKIRDRIRELRRVPASELLPNPKNWRTHPTAQRNALKGVFAEVGIADAVLVRELADGSLMLIDGHLRAEEAGETELPVLILDVNEAEADKLLATFDPLSAMAEIDSERLDGLLRDLDTSSDAIRDLLSELAEQAGIVPPDDAVEKPQPPLKTGFEIVVTCDNEEQQQQMFNRLSEEGLQCRVLTY